MATGMTARTWAGRTALVTGGTGFIGGALVRRLAALGATVIVPTRDRSRIGASDGIQYVAVRLGDAAELARQMGGVSAVFNLAYDFRRSADENVALYEAVADACVAARVPMLVQASSIAVYDGWPTESVDEASACDGPGHEYKQAKRSTERDVERRVAEGQFDATILQPTIVYGPGSPQWVDALVERMRGGTLILPENLSGLCNGVYIDDLIAAFIAAADLERGDAERFIVSGPKPFPWRDLFVAYAEACGAQVRFEGEAPALPPAPSVSGTNTSPVSALIRRASALAADTLGTARMERLRDAIMRLRPGSRIYRPVVENPRLFLSTGVANTEKLRTRLTTPAIGAHEGLARTQDYIRAKYR